MPPNTAHHHVWNHSERWITNSVSAGKSAPKPANSSLNCGMTKISRIAVMMKATTITAEG